MPAGPSDTAAALSNALAIPGVHVAAVEVGIPDGLDADAAFEELSRVHAAHPDVDIFVEVPRGDRRAGYLTALETAGHSAKFRTGGIVAEAYPNEEELADAVISVVRANIPFKATAGLHHGVRNTDPETGFEQHGFLNIMVAVDAARRARRSFGNCCCTVSARWKIDRASPGRPHRGRGRRGASPIPLVRYLQHLGPSDRAGRPRVDRPLRQNRRNSRMTVTTIDIPADSLFGLDNLPYGVFSPAGGLPRVGVARRRIGGRSRSDTG